MRRIFLHNCTHPATSPIQALYCDTFFSRFRGLMFRRELAEREGLLLVESSESRVNSSIHMLFMNFDIAVVWLNTQLQVVDVQLCKRWRPSYIPAKPAQFTLETRVEYLPEFHIGDQLAIKNA